MKTNPPQQINYNLIQGKLPCLLRRSCQFILIVLSIFTIPGTINVSQRSTTQARELNNIKAKESQSEAAKYAENAAKEGNQELLWLAIEKYKEACLYWEQASEQEEQAKTFNLLGDLYYDLNHEKEALGQYQQAFALYQALGNIQEQAKTLIYIGNAQYDLGDAQIALSYYEKALKLCEQSNDKSGQALALKSIGLYFSLTGEKQKAIDLLREALVGFRQLKDKRNEVRSLNATGLIYLSLGDYRRAIENYQESLQLARTNQLLSDEKIPLLRLGQAFEALTEINTALNYYQQCLSLSVHSGDEKYEANATQAIGAIYNLQGKKNQALASFEKALALHRKMKNKHGEALTLNYLGRVYEDLHERDLARGFYQASLATSRQILDPHNEILALQNSAHFELGRGELNQAQNYITAASETIEKLRSSVNSHELRATYLASIHQCYEIYIQILMLKSLACPFDNFATEALEKSEQSHARSFLDSLQAAQANIEKDLAPALKGRKRDLLQLISARRTRRTDMLSTNSKQEDIAKLNKEIGELELQYENLQVQLRTSNPHYAALTDPQPLDAKQIQQLLDSDTMLLEYALGDAHSYLWAVTPDRIEAFTLPKRSEIEGLVRALHDLMKVREQKPDETVFQHAKRKRDADRLYPKLAAKLSQILLQPVAHKLGNKKLVIVGDGALHYLPFGALPQSGKEFRGSGFGFRGQQRERLAAKRETQNSNPLIFNHEITMLPSASALKLLRDDQKGKAGTLDSVAVLADPVFMRNDTRIGANQNVLAANAAGAVQIRSIDLSDENQPIARLEQTRAEANAIRDLVIPKQFLLKTDFAVNRAIFDSGELSPFSILHIATHGFVDTATPDASGIVLSRYNAQGKKMDDGVLYLRDIYELKLPKELVVLSACETAWGKEIKGEGIIALSRGFFYAGAQRVMASLWSVEENATQELMAEFYRQLLKEKKTPATALQGAQIAMWQKNPTKAPYDWAAFVLQGEYR